MTSPSTVTELAVPEWRAFNAPAGAGSANLSGGNFLLGGAVVSNVGAAAELVTLYDGGAGAGQQLASISVPPGGTVTWVAPWPGVYVRVGLVAVSGGADTTTTVYLSDLD